MRKSYQDMLNNNLTKMFNTNRDYIRQELNRLSIDPKDRTKGMGDFGARQMVNYFGNNNYATVGTTMSSTIVS